MTMTFSVPPAEFAIKRSSYSQHRMASYSVLVDSDLQNASFYHSYLNAMSKFLDNNTLGDLHCRELLQSAESPHHTGVPLASNLIADGCLSRMWIGTLQ